MAYLNKLRYNSIIKEDVRFINFPLSYKGLVNTT